MSLYNLCKALLPICNDRAGIMPRNITTSSAFHAIFHIRNADDYEQIVKMAEKPIVVGFYSPISPKSKLQYDRLQEIMLKKQKIIDLAHVNVTISRILDQMELKDLWALPLLAVFDNGQIVQRLSGSHSKVFLTTWLDQAYSEAHIKIKYDF